MTRIIGWLLAAFVAWFLLTNPDGAAALVHGLLGWLPSTPLKDTHL